MTDETTKVVPTEEVTPVKSPAPEETGVTPVESTPVPETPEVVAPAAE